MVEIQKDASNDTQENKAVAALKKQDTIKSASDWAAGSDSDDDGTGARTAALLDKLGPNGYKSPA